MTQSLILGKASEEHSRVPIKCDDEGQLLVVGGIAGPSSGATPTNSVSSALEASRIISAAAAVLYSIEAANTSGTDLFLLLFDSATLPADGVRPVCFAPLPANWIGSIDYGDLGREFTTGIVAVASSTLGTKTIAGANHLFTARYKA